MPLRRKVAAGVLTTVIAGSAALMTVNSTSRAPAQPALTPFGTQCGCNAGKCGCVQITLPPYNPFTPYPTWPGLAVPTLPWTATIHPTITKIGQPGTGPTPTARRTETARPVPPTATGVPTLLPPPTLTKRPTLTPDNLTPTPDAGGASPTVGPATNTPIPTCAAGFQIPGAIIVNQPFQVTYAHPTSWNNVAMSTSTGNNGTFQNVSYNGSNYAWTFNMPPETTVGTRYIRFYRDFNVLVAECLINVTQSNPSTPIPVTTPTLTPSPTATRTPTPTPVSSSQFDCTAGMVVSANPIIAPNGVVQYTSAVAIPSPQLVVQGQPPGYTTIYGGVSGSYVYQWSLIGIQPGPIDIFVTNAGMADVRGFCQGTVQ